MHRFSRNYLSRLGNFAALVTAVMFAIGIPLMNSTVAYSGMDYDIFTWAGQGDLGGYFYPEWLLPLLAGLQYIPRPLGWLLLNLTNLAGVLYAVHVFGGNRAAIVLSFGMIFTFFMGNVDGIVAAGTAAMYESLRSKRPLPAAACWLVMLTKPHLGLPLGLALLWCYSDYRTALRCMVLVGLWGLASLVIWGWWVGDLWARIQAAEDAQVYTILKISLWEYSPLFCIILWLPLLLTRTRSFPWIVSTLLLTLPYVSMHAPLHLLVHPLGAWAWLVQLPFFFGTDDPVWFWLLPMVVYLAYLLRFVALPVASNNRSPDLSHEALPLPAASPRQRPAQMASRDLETH